MDTTNRSLTVRLSLRILLVCNPMDGSQQFQPVWCFEAVNEFSNTLKTFLCLMLALEEFSCLICCSWQVHHGDVAAPIPVASNEVTFHALKHIVELFAVGTKLLLLEV